MSVVVAKALQVDTNPNARLQLGHIGGTVGKGG